MNRRWNIEALVFAAALGWSGCAGVPARRPPAPGAVAQILGRDLFAKDLPAPPLEQADWIRGQVWNAVFDDYIRKHGLEPSKSEILQCAEKWKVSLSSDWDPAHGPIPLDLDFATSTVRGWRRDVALYRQYGGRMIFQQFGIEPVDAWRQVLEEYERAGSFVVSDPALHAAVYDYFQLHFTEVDAAAVADFVARPWCGEPLGQNPDAGSPH